ncbi:MAG: prolipoprotein diacylglyceryl transferase [Alphaproteobacteria bacterium]|nr:prolipoprotein diacylglyceryl transferase [Alphaproteobacteria bacterium]
MFVWSVSPVAFHVGSIPVYWYGVIYASALFLSWCVATWVLRKLRANDVAVPTKEEFDSFMFWGIVSIIAGARLGHVLFYDLEYFINHPLEIFMLRNGGLAFHGSVIALAVYSYSFVKRRKLSWLVLADVLSFAGALGVGIGRFANFVNQELYGKITGSDMGIIFSLVDQMPRYPTQIMEAFFEGLLNFWLLFIIFRLRGVSIIGRGVITAIFCVMYSSSRFVIEFFKDVEAYTYFGSVTLTTGQVLSIALFLFGLFVLHFSRSDCSRLSKR